MATRLEEGSSFGKYTVERLLGTGGMGAVYLVRHRMLDTNFALKVLDGVHADKDGDAVARFIREARLATKLPHENLVTVHDAGRDEATGLYYIVMDYLSGGTLRDRLRSRGHLAVDEAVSIARQMAKALVAASNLGMVHRDIKPENIMFGDNGIAKLADLGIAKSSDIGGETLVTMDSAVFGTPAYMSPEQTKDAGKVDARADIWSLGIVLFEMLSGKRPYEGSGFAAIAAQILSKDRVPHVCDVEPSVPKELGDIVADMCEKDPDKRIASAAELLDRLDSVAATEKTMVTMATMATMATMPVKPAEVTAKEAEDKSSRQCRDRRKSRRLAMVAAAVFAAICVVAALFKVAVEQSISTGVTDAPEPAPESFAVPNPSPETMHLPETSPSQVSAPSPAPEPVPQKMNIVFIGAPSEKNKSTQPKYGAGYFQGIKGRPDKVLKVFSSVVAKSPDKIFFSPCRYAADREMGVAAFEVFFKEVASSLRNSNIPVVFIAEPGSYGDIVRAVAAEYSLDVSE